MYQVDGVEMPRKAALHKVMNAIYFSKNYDLEDEVRYAYHMGVDIFWIKTEAPFWSKKVFIKEEGIVDEAGKVIEKWDMTSPKMEAMRDIFLYDELG